MIESRDTPKMEGGLGGGRHLSAALGQVLLETAANFFGGYFWPPSSSARDNPPASPKHRHQAGVTATQRRNKTAIADEVK